MASSRALVFGFGGDAVVAKGRTLTTMIERSKVSDIQLKKMRDDFVDVVAVAEAEWDSLKTGGVKMMIENTEEAARMLIEETTDSAGGRGRDESLEEGSEERDCSC